MLKQLGRTLVDAALSTTVGQQTARKSANYVLKKLERQNIRDRYYRAFFDEDNGRVLSGPYKGMRIVNEFSWGAYEPSYLLGCYEQEIQSVLAAHDWHRNTSAVDIGCANGYHAVGLARLAPDLPVHAFDIDTNATTVTRKMAEVNDVANQLSTYGEFQLHTPYDILGDRPFFLVDVEGAEVDMVPQIAQHYPRADLLIECHDRKHHDIRKPIQQALVGSHDVVQIHRQGRSPAIHPAIEILSDNQAWTVMSENRSKSDIWLYCRARTD